MEKVNKNLWIVIGIVIIVAFITLLFVLKKEKKAEVNNENTINTTQYLKYGEALYTKLIGIYFKDDLTFQQENNKNKVYKIDNQDYNKLIEKEYIERAFTEQGLVLYRNLSGMVIKDDEYYLPVTEIKHNELLNDREFNIVSSKENEASFEITSSFCTDENCISTTNKKVDFKIKNIDGDWLIDNFEIDE